MRTISVKPFNGIHMLIIMIGFFGVVFAANMTMVYFASSSWTGLVVQNSYVASQEFNERSAEMIKAAEINVSIEVDTTQVKLSLRDKSGGAVSARNVELKIGRPTHGDDDHILRLLPIRDGIYAAPDKLMPGQWTGTVTADIPGRLIWSRPVYILVKR
jgi:nitrogen fixation protein FixH